MFGLRFPRETGTAMNDTLSRLTAALADRYRLDRELGAGGMATVYLAHDLKHDRDDAMGFAGAPAIVPYHRSHGRLRP